MAVCEDGRKWWQIVQGSVTEEVYLAFLVKLMAALEEKDPGFRDKYLISHDNATIHKTPSINRVKVRNRWPLRCSGIASCGSAPVEWCFANTRKNFARRIGNMVLEKMEAERKRTLGMDQIIYAIYLAVVDLKEDVIRRTWPRSICFMLHYLTDTKI